MNEPNYLAMAQFLKPRDYTIIDNAVTFPGGLMCFCADTDEAYLMAFGHFLATELGRKWQKGWEVDTDMEGAFYAKVFDTEEFIAITQARRFRALLLNKSA